MMHIDIERLQFPEGWEQKAEAVQKALTSATNDEERAKLISQQRELWRELAPELAKLSHGKCWYCETKVLRNDNPVDHFRPKRRVHESKKHHPGYWWLAFDWRNYRFCCEYCNSRRVFPESDGGKGDHFPLVDEGARAFGPAGVPKEVPKLLDPTDLVDVAMLWFDESGKARSATREDRDPDTYARAVESIHKYHLDQQKILEARVELCRKIREKVENEDRLTRQFGVNQARAGRERAQLVAELKALLAPNEAHSATARCMLMGLAATYPIAWAALH